MIVMAEPVISYPGAKWRFWTHIKPYIPRNIKDWREPFFGGGSMSLSIADDPDFDLDRMVVGDLAPEIWAMWVGMRDNASDVIEIATKWFKDWCPTQPEFSNMDKDAIARVREYEQKFKDSKSNSTFINWAVANISNPDIVDDIKLYETAVAEGKKFWDWAEKVDCTTLSIPERAARTYLVNKISFSGMGDSGSMSKDRIWGFKLEHMDKILAAQPLLKKMEIYNQSFEKTMSDVDRDKTFVFMDPPYYKQEASGLYGRGGDTHHGFPHDKFAQITKDTNCRWFITYDDSIKVRQMFKGKCAYNMKRPGAPGKCYILPFTIPGGYTMAGKTSEDALAGEELFIANYDIINGETGDEVGFDF